MAPVIPHALLERLPSDRPLVRIACSRTLASAECACLLAQVLKTNKFGCAAFWCDPEEREGEGSLSAACWQ